MAFNPDLDLMETLTYFFFLHISFLKDIAICLFFSEQCRKGILHAIMVSGYSNSSCTLRMHVPSYPISSFILNL